MFRDRPRTRSAFVEENTPGITAMLRALACKTASFLIAAFLVACSTTGGQQAGPPPAATTTAVGTYHIGVDDVVQVSVWRNPELGIVAPVRPDGRISVPLVGDVTAAGRSPSEVAGDIQEKLAAFVREPQVTVVLTELRSHEYLSRVSVTGAVKQPISIPYRQGMTVLDAVLAAGGVNEFAASGRSDLHRKTSDGMHTYEVRLDRILQHGDLSTNYQVAPGDVITVPERVL